MPTDLDSEVALALREGDARRAATGLLDALGGEILGFLVGVLDDREPCGDRAHRPRPVRLRGGLRERVPRGGATR